MRESEKAEAYTAGINLLVDQAVTAAKPNSPGAYAATVRADLSERHRQRARELFAEHGELHGEHLALLLSAADKPQSDPITNRDTAPPLEPWTGPERSGPPTPRAKARERVAEIKAQLRNVTKQPIPENESRSA